MSVDLIMWLKQSLYIFYNSNQRFIIAVEKKLVRLGAKWAT